MKPYVTFTFGEELQKSIHRYARSCRWTGFMWGVLTGMIVGMTVTFYAMCP